jgi:hypothetical protein
MANGFVCGNGIDWSPDNKICESSVPEVVEVLMGTSLFE